MLRRSALGIMFLGSIVTLVGGAGIFAVFTDRATTGQNSVTSGELASSAHLQIATLANAQVGCGTFTDDLSTGLFSVTNARAGDTANNGVCLKNAGSSNLQVFMRVIDLVDVETGCTGDEAAAGDTTCGPSASPPTGELSSVLLAGLSRVDCSTGNVISGSSSSGYIAAPGGLLLDAGTLNSGAVACYGLSVLYDGSASATAQQKAQSDQTTWRFAFDGSTT
jgi:predicted ribosomally synthesized peptide with SipW-like signal peptide